MSGRVEVQVPAPVAASAHVAAAGHVPPLRERRSLLDALRRWWR